MTPFKILNGRRPPSWKIKKLPYFSNGLASLDEIWQVHADLVSQAYQPLRNWIFFNPRWRQPPTWKTVKSRYCDIIRILSSDWLGRSFYCVVYIRVHMYACLYDLYCVKHDIAKLAPQNYACKLCLYVCMYLYDHLCFLHRFGELFDRLLATDHVHNVVSVLCYLQSVTESLSTAVSTLSASLSSISTVILPLWTSIVAALQHHLNTVSRFLACKFSRYCCDVCLYACLWSYGTL